MRRMADFYTRTAKLHGYPARSIWKLKEMDTTHHIFRPGQRVCDLGCVPGSWTMYASEKVGSNGFVLGLDINTTTQKFSPNVRILQQDVFKWDVPRDYLSSFDVLISDMAPKTTGISDFDAHVSYELCLQACNLAQRLVKPNGTLLLKLFQGSDERHLLTHIRTEYQSVKICKPKASRSESVEIFVLATKKYPTTTPTTTPTATTTSTPTATMDASTSNNDQTPTSTSTPIKKASSPTPRTRTGKPGG